MFDPKQLLEQFLGGPAGGGLRGAGQQVKDTLDRQSGSGGFVRGAATGGLLGLLIGNKKMRSGALGYGGAAVVGALALKAYQAYQQNAAVRPVSISPAEFAAMAPKSLPHSQAAADGGAFELIMVRAMVAAAKADGHIDAQEQRRLFTQVERMSLDSESKAFVFDLLAQPVDLASIAGAVASPEQGAEVYLASRMVIDPDHPAERAYLDALAARLKLPNGLREQLDGASS